MSDGIEAFHSELFQDVLRRADASGSLTPDAFFERFGEPLVDSGELRTADRAHYSGLRGVRLDGYGGDPTEADGVLSVIISDFSQAAEIETLTATDMEAQFKRAVAFIRKSLDRQFRLDLEETSPAFGVADTISSSWASVRRISVILITNRLLSDRVDGYPAGDIDGRPVTYGVWDIGRLFRYEAAGREREDLIVDMAEYGGNLPALPAHLSHAGYEAYLVVVSGSQLAAIYDRWGARLLEQNVRVFLQARGGVNRGIKNTLDNDPSMFFAYNNGITATAENVTTSIGRNGLAISALQNLQIVNGGQTTASIAAAARRPNVDLSKVFVQMKLSIIPNERAKEVVPKISEFANSQNKVNAADFFANHPFHIRMKQFSGTTYASDPSGSFKQTKWFYERARGEFQDARATLVGKGRKEFDLEYPKSQIFTKTDLAKFLSSWDGFPHLVSRGAQTNFAFFAERIGKSWDANPDVFNQLFFEDAVAKAIIFRHTERVVSSQPWYEGAYRANVVTHTIAKLAYDVQEMGKSVNFGSIWKQQTVSESFEDALAACASEVFRLIVSPPEGAVKNITEWAKRVGCWTKVQEARISWPRAFRAELLSEEEEQEVLRTAKSVQKVLSGIEAQVAVTRAGASFWMQAQSFAGARRLLSVKQAEILALVAHRDNVVLSDKQSLVVMEALRRLREDGFSLALPE